VGTFISFTKLKMANSIAADFLEVWAKEQQTVFYKSNVAMKVADMSFNAQMKRGDTLNRPFRSTAAKVQAYVRGTDIDIDDMTDTQEQLSVNREFATGRYIDDFDTIQSNYNLAAAYGRDDAMSLSNQVDADYLGEVINATSTVDDGSVGGTAGDAIVLTTSNVLSVIASAKQKLQKQNVPLSDLFGVVSPEFERVLIEYGAGRDTQSGDRTQNNGFITDFYGFKLFSSNQLANTAVLALATNPTNGDVIIVNGVTFTAVSSIGTTAGNFLIAGTADLTRSNLESLMSNPATTSANQVALGEQNAREFENVVSANNDDVGNLLTVVYKGIGQLVVSATLAAGAPDGWGDGAAQHNFFGSTGAPTIVMQSSPSVTFKEEPKKHGGNILNGVLYGVKTFADNAKQMVSVNIEV
jgi:hypothetical protein